MFGKSLPFELFERVRKKDGELTSEMSNAKSEANTSLKKKYYSGLWFEEYVFLRLKKQFGLDAGYVAKGVKIFRSAGQSNDNELDVVCMIDNALYVVECKALSKWVSAKVDGYLYKLAAVSKNYGLQVNSYLVTSHNMDKLPDGTRAATEKRQRILEIKGIIGFRELCKGKLTL